VKADDPMLRAAALFSEALELPPGERAAFLAVSCVGAPEIHSDVVSLLEAHNSLQDFLDPPDQQRIAGLFDDTSAVLQAGHRIGAYRVLHPIGQGGMGTVYLAERADGAFEHRVALKVVRDPLATGAVRRRFQQERNILARLDHPGIARLFDGGVTDDGRPYLVMEFVDGEPITAACVRRQLSLETRLRLFADVCAAVQHAHRNLVIHRDIKPANVLVNASGEAKLVDFGIATLTERALDDDTPTLTQAGTRVLTPDYAAPEQILGGPITTATDVYGLGVVLYELLSGSLPHDFRGAGLAEMARILSDETPVAPSVSVRTAVRTCSAGIASLQGIDRSRLARSLRGDLDAIVLMSLRREPARRYPSVDAFRDDILRHLAGRPVSARPDSLRYRFSRLVRRNPVAVSAVALAVSSLVLGLGGTAWQGVRAANERDRARFEASRAQAASDFMARMFQLADVGRLRGTQVTVRETLDSARLWVTRELSAQPAIRADVGAQLAGIYYGLGLYEESVAMWHESLAASIEWLGDRNEKVFHTRLMLGQSFEARGQPDSAERVTRQALEILAALPDSTRAFSETHALVRLGEALRQQGRYAEADSVLLMALAVLPEDNPSAPHRRTVILTVLGHVRRATGNAAGAEAVHREVLAARRRLWGDEHTEVANVIANLAGAVADQGRYSEAESLYAQVLGMRRRLQGESHAEYGNDLADLALLLGRKGDVAGADSTLQRARAIQVASLGPDHSRVATTELWLGELYLVEGRAGDAQIALRSALGTAQAAGNAVLTAMAQSALGAALGNLRHDSEGRRLLISAEATLSARLGTDAPETRLARDRLAQVDRRR